MRRECLRREAKVTDFVSNTGSSDGVSRNGPQDPTAQLVALAAPGRNPSDITIPVLAGSEGSGGGGDEDDEEEGGSGGQGSPVVQAPQNQSKDMRMNQQRSRARVKAPPPSSQPKVSGMTPKHSQVIPPPRPATLPTFAPPRMLTKEEQLFLKEFFIAAGVTSDPKFLEDVLKKVTVWDQADSLHVFVRGAMINRKGAITLGSNRYYLLPPTANDPSRIHDLGHECTHSLQSAQFGELTFQLIYVQSSAEAGQKPGGYYCRGNPFEIMAYAMDLTINATAFQALRQGFLTGRTTTISRADKLKIRQLFLNNVQAEIRKYRPDLLPAPKPVPPGP